MLSSCHLVHSPQRPLKTGHVFIYLIASLSVDLERCLADIYFGFMRIDTEGRRKPTVCPAPG